MSKETLSKPDLDQLRLAYKKTVDEWVTAIRAEEDLATPDHPVREWDLWDAAHFREEDAHAQADEAREAYKDGLRKVDYGI